ncbi:MAG TPA: TIGR04282 family arsenosugar biosynthesis glycosyltransferase [Flavobacteriaceae bacterium]|nr:TIGR04282 family arsenosugar biosynthesis glycosyltransferase [Flavobacteriaceae bacterium]
MSANLLLIFARHPELGKVKTRLAKSIGDEKALKIYKFLLKRTLSITQNLPMDKEVWYVEGVQENDKWDRKFFDKKTQKGEDLGERMQNAFSEGFQNGYEKIVIVGTDIYDLTENDILSAFEKLQENDVVIGPAADGGYYLLGMKTLRPEIFQDKNWGSGTVLKETLADLNPKTLFLLETRHDVDVYEDIVGIDTFKIFL